MMTRHAVTYRIEAPKYPTRVFTTIAIADEIHPPCDETFQVMVALKRGVQPEQVVIVATELIGEVK